MKNTFRILVAFDEEAGVWIVNDSDVPGLNAEADSIEELREKLLVMIPELLELNEVPLVPEELLIQSEQRIALTA